MKNKRTGLGQALLVVAFASLLPLWAAAQQVTVNRVYDFSGNTDTLNSQLNYVYADSTQIIALGEAHPTNQKPYAFTAAFDYSGNLLWEKPIRLPGNLYTPDSGFNNLIKAGPGLYVAGGNIENAPKAGTYVSNEPFLYFFNAQGDSLHLIRLQDSLMNQRMTALAVNEQGSIIVGASKVPVGSPLNTQGNYWFAELDHSGNLIRQKILLVSNTVYPYWPNIDAGITKIIPVSWGTSLRYVIAINSYYPDVAPQIAWLDSTFNPITAPFVYTETIYGNDYDITMTRYQHFEFNLIARKGHPYSFFWSFPVQIASWGTSFNGNFLDGVYFCRAQINPTPPAGGSEYDLNWYRAFLDPPTTLLPLYTTFDLNVQDRSELAEAVNGDLLVQKEAYRPSDTVTYPPQLSKYYLPVLLRAGDTGELKWGRTFQYIHTVDSGIYHNFYDVSVAPDGRIVMAGFLRSRYPVPGYDTVGKVSWLVVLSDTVHDQQPQPPESISLTAAGQKAQLLVYPNPTLNYTTIDLQNFNGAFNDLTWQLCDIKGRILKSRKFNGPKTIINLSGFASGVYFIKVGYKGKQVGAVKVLKD